MILGFVCILHIGVCIWITRKYQALKEKNKDFILPLVYAVPLFGALCYGLRWYTEYRQKVGQREIEHNNGSILTGKYQKIEVSDDVDLQVVPLEEALVMNNETVRHNLMISILNKRPQDSLEMLQKARSSSDTEVTHYATTMMMEILTEYEKKLQEYEKQYQKNPTKDLLREYILYMQEFIHSKLISGNVEKVYRQKLSVMIDSYFEHQEQYGKLIFISIENYLMLGEFDKAGKQLELAKKEYPNDERLMKLYGHYFDSMKQYDRIQEMTQFIKENHIYLSHEGREWLTFWG